MKKFFSSFTFTLALSFSLYAVDESSLLSTYETLIEEDSKNLSSLSRQAQNEENLLKNAHAVKINSKYLESLFFLSPTTGLNLLDSKNPCSFYALLENGLLSSSLKNKDHILLDIYSSSDKYETFEFTIQNYINHVYLKSCLSNKEFRTLYAPVALANTLEMIQFKIPRQYAECEEELLRWEQNTSLPYLCASRKYFNLNQSINGPLKESLTPNTLQSLESIPYFKKSYITSLCQNLKNPKTFCDSYISTQIWQKIIIGEYPSMRLEYLCRHILKKEALSPDDLSICAERITKDAALCETTGNTYTSLMPKIDCKLLALATEKSKIKANYTDCPSIIGQDGILNTHRLLRHFQKTPIKDFGCMNNPVFDVGMLFISYATKDEWPLKICFHNPHLARESCEIFIPGKLDTNKYSEHTVMAQILKTMQVSLDTTSCKIVTPQTFNPARLEYKTGCIIVKDPQSCQSFNCNPEVYYQGSKVESIRYDTPDTLNYFPSTWNDEKYSLSRIFSLSLKQETTPIRNLSEAIFFLENDPSSLIHGSGCLEDLLPDFFRKQNFNDCSVSSFIVDGFVRENGETRAIVRTGLDEVHLPRLIQWNRIFNAVSNYQKIHPINAWNLYGNQ